MLEFESCNLYEKKFFYAVHVPLSTKTRKLQALFSIMVRVQNSHNVKQYMYIYISTEINIS